MSRHKALDDYKVYVCYMALITHLTYTFYSTKFILYRKDLVYKATINHIAKQIRPPKERIQNKVLMC